MSHRRFGTGGLGHLAALLALVGLLSVWLYRAAQETNILMIMSRDATTEVGDIPASGSQRAIRVSLTSYHAFPVTP
jgi:hypothetical protein